MRLRSVAEPLVKVSEVAHWRPLPEMCAAKTPLDANADTALQSINAPKIAHVRESASGNALFAIKSVRKTRLMAARGTHRQSLGSGSVVAAPYPRIADTTGP